MISSISLYHFINKGIHCTISRFILIFVSLLSEEEPGHCSTVSICKVSLTFHATEIAKLNKIK